MRCPTCHYLTTGPCGVCAAHAPTTRVTRVAQTLAGQSMTNMITTPQGLPQREIWRAQATTARPQIMRVRAPRPSWDRARCLTAGHAWIAAHPGVVLLATHCTQSAQMPSINSVYKVFGTLRNYRDALGLPVMVPTPTRTS